MSYNFDKFIERIVSEERVNSGAVDSQKMTEEQLRQVDPNRQRIMGREHWMNRTRGTWARR
jgi:hypothetical protein